jgi:regulator of protease activity HflC (stomatin/prohibitin superfamily)
MKTERERRSKILDTEGQKRSEVLVAEGHKEAEILRAAARETKIQEAQGEAEVILSVPRAFAKSANMLNAASSLKQAIALKSL